MMYIFEPLLSSISNIFLLIIVLFLLVYIARFIIASQTVVIGLMLSVLLPILETVGLHPFVTGLMIYMGCNVWFMLYQNTIFMACFGSMQGTIEAKSATKLSYVYALVMIIASFISIPYWNLLGYIG